MGENVTYEVGKFYNVPCVLGEWGNRSKRAWWPVMGSQHEDKDIIGFPHQHYHIDWRFVARPQTDWFQAAVSALADNPLAYNYNLPLMTWHLNEHGLPAPVLRRRKCQRPHALPWDLRRITWMPKLEAAYKGCKLAKGHICPHRGFDLSHEPVVNGVVTCPLHGLRWNIETGELAPRTCAPQSWEKT